MTKRPSISDDLLRLTSGDVATPMPEASQRTAKPASPTKPLPESITRQAKVEERNTEPLNFNVRPSLSKRFRLRAFEADLFHNELLEQALDAWEEKHGHKSQKS